MKIEKRVAAVVTGFRPFSAWTGKYLTDEGNPPSRSSAGDHTSCAMNREVNVRAGGILVLRKYSFGGRMTGQPISRMKALMNHLSRQA
jgi:hypothetical protein